MYEYYSSDKMNRFEMGLEILNRLEAERADNPLSSDNEIPSTVSELNIHYALPELDDILEELSPLPFGTLLIGAGEDGLPILLDLNNPVSGSILVAGEAGCGKTRLLRSMVHSACITSQGRNLHLYGITNSRLEWQKTEVIRHRSKWSSTHSLEAAAILRELTEIVEQRRTGREGQGIHLLVIDELGVLLDDLDADTIAMLDWLVRNGPYYGAWTLASIDCKRLTAWSKMVGSFGTWLYGYTHSLRTKHKVGDIPEEISSSLIPGAQFCLKIEDIWLRFWIPAVG